MKAAVLTQTGTVPCYTDFPDPETDLGPGQVVIDVTAAGVHHLDLTRASGAYGAPARLPCVIGGDGVGRTRDGRRVFFTEPVAPHGSWAQQVLVAEENVLDLADGVDDITAAALGNTGLAAWLALTWRGNLQPGESVLVLGATGALGSIAVQIAKVLGAGLVVAADRDADRLARACANGADATVTLSPDIDLTAEFRRAAAGRGYDVIIDPLWGPPALAAMHAAAQRARHIQIGQSAGATIELPAGLVRGSRLEILGFAHIDAPVEARREAYRRLTELAAADRLRVDSKPLPLSDVDQAWELQQQGAPAKLVLIP